MNLRLILPLAGLGFLLAACGGGGGGEHKKTRASGPDIRLTGLRVLGTTTVAAAVSVLGVADQDGAVDTAFSVAFALDGGGGATSLPEDPGATATPPELTLPVLVDGAASDLRLTWP